VQTGPRTHLNTSELDYVSGGARFQLS
jgi:hypothetical protein